MILVEQKKTVNSYPQKITIILYAAGNQRDRLEPVIPRELTQ